MLLYFSYTVFSGNYDSSAVVTNTLQSPIVARYVRLVPVTWNENIRMTVDVIGCAFEATGTCECDDEWQVDGEGACTVRECDDDFVCYNGGLCDIDAYNSNPVCICMPGFNGRDCSGA